MADDSAPAPASDEFAVGALPPGPVADRLAEAAAHVPDRPDRVLALADEAAEVARETDDELGAAMARTYAGFARYLRSEHEEALDLLTRALADLEPLGDLAGRSLALGALASVHVSLGHYDEALSLALDNLQTARAIGDREREAWVLATMGNTYVELRQPDQAIERGEAALRLFAALDHGNGQARAHTVLGGALRDLGRYPEAEAHHQAALRLAREQGAALTEARALDDLGDLARARGELDDALRLHRDALQLRTAAGNRQAQATSLLNVGRTLVAMGRPDDARPALEEALGIAQAVGAEPREAQAHAALADALEAGGQPQLALDHFRRYHALREALLSAQARSRIQSVEVRAEADRARRDADLARMRTDELGALNDELQAALDDLRKTQGRLVQTEKLASLGRLSAGLAHEIQNPLNFVANFADLNADLATDLLEGVAQARSGRVPDLDRIAEDLEAIVDNAGRVRAHARRAEGIVSGLMGHVRDVGGERRPADLHELIERAVSTTLRDSAVRVERRYAPGLDPVGVVPGSIQRVFVNVLANARWSVLKHAETTGAVPTVEIETEDLGDAVEVRVSDNGVGIPADHCPRVFEPFFTTKPAGTGTGLGLSLAYDIVAQGHEGTLAVHSREGEGATFRITLPR